MEQNRNEIIDIELNPQRPNKDKKKIIIGCIALIATLIIGALIGIFIGFQIKKDSSDGGSARNGENDSTVNSATDEENNDNGEEDKTTNWLTFTSDFGFSFRYPSEWVLRELGAQSTMDGVGIFIETNITSPGGSSLQLIENITGIGGMCGLADNDYFNSMNVRYFGESNIDGFRVISMGGSTPGLSSLNVRENTVVQRCDSSIGYNFGMGHIPTGLGMTSFGGSIASPPFNNEEWPIVIEILKSASIN